MDLLHSPERSADSAHLKANTASLFPLRQPKEHFLLAQGFSLSPLSTMTQVSVEEIGPVWSANGATAYSKSPRAMF